MDYNNPPPPAAMDPRLLAMLGGAKKVMKKVESGDYETGNIDARALTQDGIESFDRSEVMEHTAAAQSKAQEIRDYSNQDEYVAAVKNSKLPAVIKEAMIKTPIKQVGMGHTFNIEDVAQLIDKPMGLPKVPKTNPRPAAPQQRRTIAESYVADSDSVTVSREELSEIVDELVNAKLLEFFMQNHNKRIVDEAVKRTVSVLIKEGKLKKAI